MSTADLVLECDSCGSEHDLKPDASFQSRPTGPATRLLARRLSRARAKLQGNWFLVDENWSVAEFFLHLTTVDTEKVLGGLLGRLGLNGERGDLKEVLYWPRLLFGVKTIQPDVVLVFERHVVFWEFKRPMGGTFPAHELSGQAAFLSQVEAETGFTWDLVVVPGPERGTVPNRMELAIAIQEGQSVAQAKWNYSPRIAADFASLSADDLAGRIACLSWERLLSEALQEIHRLPNSWNRSAATRGLIEFHRERADILAPLAPFT